VLQNRRFVVNVKPSFVRLHSGVCSLYPPQHTHTHVPCIFGVMHITDQSIQQWHCSAFSERRRISQSQSQWCPNNVSSTQKKTIKWRKIRWTETCKFIIL